MSLPKSFYPAYAYNLKMYNSSFVLYDLEKYFYEQLDNVYVPTSELHSWIEDKSFNVSLTSAYLMYMVLSNMLDSEEFIKADYEKYYIDNLTNYYHKHGFFRSIKAKDFAHKWSQLDRLLTFLYQSINSYKSSITNYEVTYTDGNNNYYDNIPLIGSTVRGKVDLYFIFFKDNVNNPNIKSYLDIYKIPSCIRCIGSVLNRGLVLNQVINIYLNHKDFLAPNQIVKYSQYMFKDKDFIKYIKDYSNPSNYSFNVLDNYLPFRDVVEQSKHSQDVLQEYSYLKPYSNLRIDL